MALRGCVILLFVLLSGSVYADDTAMTLAPGMQEPSPSQILTVTQTGSPSSSAAPTATTLPTTEAPTTVTTEAPTTVTTEAPTTVTTEAPTTVTTEAPTTVTTEAPTTVTTEAPTTVTTEAPTTKTTEAPTTVTTEAPTTHQNTTNSTTETTTHHIPTTQPPTTPHHNTTNSTTVAPTTAHTNATTAPTPPPTTPPVPKPTVGNYSVRHGVNSSVCLLANMGLQFSFTSGNASRQTVNVDPNVTAASGTCGSGGSDSSLVLKSDKITVHFVFTNFSGKFRLHALVLSIDIGQGSFFNESNTNLSLWEASVGSSYMCRKEQTYNISDKLAINTFELQVQPFAVKNTFSTAHECSMDDISLLIPIIVGAVLAGLIFIVVIAYVIGRRRTYVGYQTL